MTDDDDRSPIRFAPASPCKHLHWLIDGEQSEVTCEECGEILDPYWCLRGLAKWTDWSTRRLAKLREVEKEIADWQAQEQAKRRAKQLRIRGVVGDGA